MNLKIKTISLVLALLMIVLALTPQSALSRALAVKKKYLQCMSIVGSENYSYFNIKSCNSYDANWNIQTTQNWDHSVLSNKDDLTYDSHGNRTGSIRWRWIAATSTWVYSEKREYTYDVNNNNTSYQSSLWDTTKNAWVSSVKYEYTYNAGNKMLTYTESEWNAGSRSWVFNYRSEKTYDAADSQLTFVVLNWSSTDNVWVPVFKYESTYDSSGNRQTYIESSWNSAWKIQDKNEYSYDSNRRMDKSVYWTYDTTKQVYVLTSKSEYTYDAGNNVVATVVSNWDGPTSSWIYYVKAECSYEKHGNLAAAYSSRWNTPTSAWVANPAHTIYNYDTVGNKLSCYIWDAYGLDEIITYTNDADGYVLTEVDEKNAWGKTTTYTYVDPTPTAQALPSAGSLSVMSISLARNNLTLRISRKTPATIEIFSVSGRRLFSRAVTATPGANTMRLPAFARGALLCRVSTPRGEETSRLFR